MAKFGQVKPVVAQKEEVVEEVKTEQVEPEPIIAPVIEPKEELVEGGTTAPSDSISVSKKVLAHLATILITGNPYNVSREAGVRFMGRLIGKEEYADCQAFWKELQKLHLEGK